jgi:hypothetical protein
VHRIAPDAPGVFGVVLDVVEAEIAAVVDHLGALRQFGRGLHHADAVGRREEHHVGRLLRRRIVGLQDRQVAEALQVRIELAHRHARLRRRHQRLDLRLGMPQQQLHDPHAAISPATDYLDLDHCFLLDRKVFRSQNSGFRMETRSLDLVVDFILISES